MKIFNVRYFLVGLGFLFLLPNFLPRPKVLLVNMGHRWERFDPQLALRLQSVDDLLQYTDSAAKANRSDSSPLGYANELANVVRNRFYHGYSNYSLRENWIAVIAGSLIWSDLSAIVLPNDILKYPNAACSQQSIVMMECFKRKGIPFRKIGYDHHFALEGLVQGKWYYFDPDLEPEFYDVKRNSIDSIFAKQEEFTIYKNRLDSAGIESGLANKTIGEVNTPPAPRASLFHLVTKVLSKTLWLLPLGLLFYFNRRKKLTKGRLYEENELAA
ncbi:hypothetical protein OCK74_19435 [Chitinophagaceae bacterium LB-8]|uniref:Transglutaminase domain-containing protein n=1 Tax=Paraflavisolibacter caeni TaxID=2982496 RepID=A0A9X3BGP7_9BACT|nr:hypothetical protein [Paraflavisolibacter caeni]MCU7551304.1 hypothetical protein [Paraflavisolibacter caeni]